MDARLPGDVAGFFDVYLQRLQALWPDRVHGCYLYGSIALGAYDPAKSDLDFMTILTQPLDDEALPLLSRFHARLRRSFPLARRLEGHYVPLCDLAGNGISGQYLSLYQGKCGGMQGVMILYRYQLQAGGVRIAGPAPATLFPPVPWEMVDQEMERNINGYWLRRTQQAWTLLADASVEFAVLTLCRILYTLEHRQIISKEEAGHRALHHLPARWHPLIQEALRLRTGAPHSGVYPSRTQRAAATRAFILAMREWCNREYFAVGVREQDIP